MVQQVTKGIKISVETTFEGSFYKNYKIQYAFGYTVTIENQSKDSVQLNARHWEILDALNNVETVSGEGVIGKKPVLQPGESHTYTSGCLLTSPFGAMQGHYSMVNFTTTKKFQVTIPTFKLSAPFAKISFF
jgi:ApaG protein